MIKIRSLLLLVFLCYVPSELFSMYSCCLLREDQNSIYKEETQCSVENFAKTQLFYFGTNKKYAKALEDNTHFNSFGANEIALCVIKGIGDLTIPLKHYITKQTPSYNSKKPNSISTWTLPMSSRFEIVKPDGN